MCLRGWMSNMVFSLSLTLSHSLTLSLVSFCIGQIIRYNQMSSIHILVPTPSVPPTEEHDDDDEQAAPLALTWCCVYIVSILEKKTPLSPSLSLCVSQFPSLPHSLSLSPALPPSPKHPKPSLPSSPKSYRIQVVYIIEADQMYAMFLCCSCCCFCVFFW